MKFDPFNVTRTLYGCASYEEIWEPGIKGWGKTDSDSYISSVVSTSDYDRLLAMYCEAKGISMPTYAASIARIEEEEERTEKWWQQLHSEEVEKK